METTLNIEVITETFEQIIYFGYFFLKNTVWYKNKGYACTDSLNFFYCKKGCSCVFKIFLEIKINWIFT